MVAGRVSKDRSGDGTSSNSRSIAFESLVTFYISSALRRRVLTTTGDIRAGFNQLIVDDVHGWVRGAGVGIPGAAADGTALVARVVSIRRNVLTLRDTDTAANDALRVTITNDDRLPIEAAINSLPDGGTVNFPAGMYIIGTPGASANQPLVLHSNLHLIGAERTMTLV